MASETRGLNFDLERKHDRLLSRRQFARRMALAIGFAAGILAFALTLGTLGYHFVAKFSWIDSFLNASMILTGMGPVGEIRTTAGKLFASCYALFSGMIFITVVAVTLTPLLHRLLHKFHIDEADFDKKQRQG
jgi:hypothetical protein